MTEARKRQFSRIDYTGKVTLYLHGKGYGPYSVRNLSLGGMFVFSDFTQETGELCQVVFEADGLRLDKPLELSATTVRGDKQGVAMKFTSMTHETYTFLQVALLYESDDPLWICLEFPEDSPCEVVDSG